MEDLLYDLQTIQWLRDAVKEKYASNKEYEKFVECVYLIDDIEKSYIKKLNVFFNQK